MNIINELYQNVSNSGSHWSYSYYVNEVSLDPEAANLTTGRDSVYSGIPGYNFSGIEDSAELTSVNQRFQMNDDPNECYSNYNKDKLLDFEHMRVNKELAAEMFAKQSMEQLERPCRISNTVPHR